MLKTKINLQDDLFSLHKYTEETDDTIPKNDRQATKEHTRCEAMYKHPLVT